MSTTPPIRHHSKKKKHTEQSRSKFFSSIGQAPRKFTNSRRNNEEEDEEELDEEEQEELRLQSLKYGSRALEENQASKYEEKDPGTTTESQSEKNEEEKQMQYYRTLTTLYNRYSNTTNEPTTGNPLQAFASMSTQFITKPWEREWLQLDKSHKEEQSHSTSLDLQELAQNLRQLSIEEKLHLESDFDRFRLNPALRISHYKPTMQKQEKRRIDELVPTSTFVREQPTKQDNVTDTSTKFETVPQVEQGNSQLVSSTLELLDSLLEEDAIPVNNVTSTPQPSIPVSTSQQPPQDLEDWLDTIL